MFNRAERRAIEQGKGLNKPRGVWVDYVEILNDYVFNADGNPDLEEELRRQRDSLDGWVNNLMELDHKVTDIYFDGVIDDCLGYV